MVTGRDRFEETVVNILSPIDSTGPQYPETYRQTKYTRSTQGEALSRYAKRGDSRTFAGRPQTAQRLIDLTGDYETPPGDLVGGTSYLLVSEGADITESLDVERSSVNYANVFTQQELLEVAQVDLSQRNTVAKAVSLNLNDYLPWEEGDMVNYEGRQYVLESTSLTIRPQRFEGETRLVNESFDVSLGAYLLPSVSLYLVNENDEVILLNQI